MPKRKFFCPNRGCHANLNPGTKIVLKARNENGKEGIILLSPQVGNYTVFMEEDFLCDEERVRLFCPVCGESLLVVDDDRFAHVWMRYGES